MEQKEEKEKKAGGTLAYEGWSQELGTLMRLKSLSGPV